jgi:hypothetical protein
METKVIWVTLYTTIPCQCSGPSVPTHQYQRIILSCDHPWRITRNSHLGLDSHGYLRTFRPPPAFASFGRSAEHVFYLYTQVCRHPLETFTDLNLERHAQVFWVPYTGRRRRSVPWSLKRVEFPKRKPFSPRRTTAEKKLHVSLYVLHVLQGGVSFLTNCRARGGRMGMRYRMCGILISGLKLSQL